MNWGEIIGIVLGSSTITSLLNIFANRRINAAQADGIILSHVMEFVKTFERRIERLSDRVARLETRDAIFDRATAHAYRCKGREECPVLRYLEQHPLPSKIDPNDEDNHIGSR